MIPTFRIPVLCLAICLISNSSSAQLDPESNGGYTDIQQGRQRIRLLFTGNTQGYIDPCDCGGGLLGGLDRRAAAVKEMVDQNRPAVLFDLGNLFEEPPNGQLTVLWRRQARFLSNEMQQMGYVFTALGIQDLSLDPSHLTQHLPRLQFPPLLTNRSPEQTDWIETVPRIRLRLGELTLDFFNIVEPDLVERSGLVSSWRAILHESLYESAHGENPADLQVVIAHIRWDTSESMPADYPEIDVLINGMLTIPRQGTRVENSIGMTAAHRGQMLAVLDLTSRMLPYQKDGKSAILGFHGHHIRLLPSSDSDLEVYQRISALIEELRRDNLIPP